MPRPLRHFAICTDLAVCVLLGIMLAVTGCPRPPPPPPEPVDLEGVPVIRVLVASGSEIRLATTGGYRILADGRAVASSMDPLPEAGITHRGRTWSVHRAAWRGDQLAIEATGRSFLRVGGISYRGRIVLLPDARRGIIAVNHLDVESYLAGVLRRELYPSWPLETYKAQAVAARTYALYEKAVFGARKPYDVQDDQSSQVYGGFSAETDKAWQAVRETRGLVLAAGSAGEEKMFRAHYSSCCGGVTNSVYVLYGPPVTTGPLAGGVVCTDCRAATRHTWPPVKVSKQVIYRALSRVYAQVKPLGAVEAIKVISERNGRPVWIDVVGPGRQKVRIRADDLRLCLLRYPASGARGLYSMNCRIRDAGDAILFDFGRGFGHGVGMCQWGARGKAVAGLGFEAILAAYYPDSKLFKAYP